MKVDELQKCPVLILANKIDQSFMQNIKIV
jgi:hypothetical protein